MNNGIYKYTIEARTRDFGIDFGGKSNIIVKDIDFKAANIYFNNAQRSKLINSNILYSVPWFEADGYFIGNTDPGAEKKLKRFAVRVNGAENEIVNCTVAYSWGGGIVLQHTRDNTASGNNVNNCTIHHINWSASGRGAINASGKNHIIEYNKIEWTSAAALVIGQATRNKIRHNDISNFATLTDNIGAIRTWHTNGENTQIAYNWIKDGRPMSILYDNGKIKNKIFGIYLDEDSSNYLVNNNVIWNSNDGLITTGIWTNCTAENHKIYHNTIWNVNKSMGSYWCGQNGESIINQRVYNNLSSTSNLEGNFINNNITDATSNYFYNVSKGDFRIRHDSQAIDYGMFIDGFTENYSGNYPDAGAYEYGDNWVAGIQKSPILSWLLLLTNSN